MNPTTCSTLCRHGLRTSGRGVSRNPRCWFSTGDGLDAVAGACSAGRDCS